MSMKTYMKKEHIDINELSADDLISMVKKRKAYKIPFIAICALLAMLSIPVITLAWIFLGDDELGYTNDDLISFVSPQMAATSTKKDLISIPTGGIKANPFLPYREIGTGVVNDIPQFDLIEPPDMVNTNSEAARVMDTVVSGILYDKFSPSAILNIEGNDYLVKKGDVVNNYKILNITQNSVTVQLGANVYTAGIGEILTEGELNKNIVSNLSKRFGGGK